jgi:diaminopimelate epimerase
LNFCKYQGAGNDFVIIDNMDLKVTDISELAVSICDRRFGVGADGFILAEPSSAADVKMDFYNSDGSMAAMCGN